MRLVFALAWLALLVFLGATWSLLPEVVGASHKALPRDRHMTTMLALALFCPWLATHGSLLMARRWPRLVNLPHGDYWLTPERREQTLADMGSRLATLGLGMVMLFAGVHCQALQRAVPGWPQVPAQAWVAGAVGLGLGFALWLLALWRRFGRLPVIASARPARRGSRSRDLVWRETQWSWPGLALIPALCVGLWWLGRWDESIPVWKLALLPVMMVLFYGRMVTDVHGDRLAWRFGWLPWPWTRWQVDLDDIVAIEPAASRWIEGWGIRFTRTDRLYNASGTQAVRLTLRDGRRLRLGSQDPRQLLQALQGRIAGS